MFKKSKFKDYSKMFQKFFLSTRRIEEIFKSISNLLYDSISNDQKQLLIETKRGLFCDINECNYCNKPVKENTEIDKSIYFPCGHVYHTFCCAIERGKYACFICRMNDLEDSMFTDIPNLVFRKKQNVIKKEIKNKAEEEKMKKNRSKLIKQLNKIRKKNFDKFENFKTNINNIDIKI